jgi:hypothetical protein
MFGVPKSSLSDFKGNGGNIAYDNEPDPKYRLKE